MPFVGWLIFRKTYRALRATLSLLSNLDVMRALPWPYIRRLPRRNRWIGFIAVTLCLSLVLVVLSAIPGQPALAGIAFFISLLGILSAGVHQLAGRPTRR
jgi:hypothetical protein